jgi:uncharacterized protein YjiS (DUF1127 family)
MASCKAEAAMVTREFFRRWREYRQLLCELKSYSDVELAELGMLRSACWRTAFDAAFGSPLEELRKWLRSPGARARRGRSIPHELARLRVRISLIG